MKMIGNKILIIFLLVSQVSFADILLNETFPSPVLPAGWTNTAIQGSDIWLVRNAPAFGSTSGGNYAVFDDQLLGAAVIPNEAALRSPSVDCSNRTAIFLSYSHHWFGVEFTHGYVEVSNDGGTVWNTVKDYHKFTRGSIAVPQDTILDISAFAANQSDVSVRFRYTDGGQAGRYWYLDDIKIYADPDVGVTALTAPPYLSCGQTYSTTESVTIEVFNYGVNPVSNIPVTCDVTGALTTTINGTVPGPIAAGTSVFFTFPATINMSANGVYNFYSYTTLATDQYLNNDTLYDSRQQLVVTTYPYVQDFNGTTAGWQATGSAPPLNGGRNFSHGALTYLNGPQGQGDSWFVETTSSNNGTYIWVESPVFDFSTLTNPQLTMDIKHSLHNSDYFHVEYSLNGGTSWVLLGSTEPNWYNATSWWRNSYTAPVDAWTQVQKSLCALAGQSCVKLRVYGRPYYSTPTYSNYHMFAFDNIVIQDGPDVGVTAYIDPVDVGCLFATTQQVTVTVYNFSCNAEVNIPITCDITGAITQTLVGTVPGPIPAGGSVNYTFSTTINMTPLGTYNFNTYTALPGDINANNDAMATSINVTNLKVTTYPYFEDFNSGPGFWTASGTAPPLNNGRNFVLNPLPYLNGPQGNGDSWYVETTSSNNGTFIWAESPVFDFTNLTNPNLNFDIKHSLHNSDYFHVEYSLNGGATWVQLGAAISPTWYNATNWWRNSYLTPVDAWTNVNQDLCNLSGEPCVKFRVYGRPYYSMPTYSNYHLFAFDNFYISAGEPDDVEPIEIILSDAGDCAAYSTTETISVLIRNNTCRPITNLPIDLQLNGGPTISEVVPGPIPRFDTYIYTFTATLDLSPPGTHNISVTTQLTTDNVPANDNLVENRFSSNPINTFPYAENFNADNGGWVSRTTVNHRYFRLDTLPYLNGAQGQGDSWYVETTQSNNGTYIWVESPEFDFTALTNPQLTMDIKHSLHNSDYFHVEYSLNGGATWVLLGSTEPNWYNATSWWRNSYTAPVDAWTQVQKSLCVLAGQSCVKLRVYGRPYYSTPTYSNYHMFAFDNVAIEDGPDVGVVTYIDPVDVGCLFAQTQQVTVEVYNWGCAPISNVPITGDVTGAITQTLVGTVPGPIPVGGSVNYTFPTSINMTPLGIYNFNTYTSLPGDVNASNDALATSINVNILKVTTYPYFEDFNSGPGFWTATGTAPPLNNGRNFVLNPLPYLNGPQGNGDSWYVETTSSNNGTFIWVESPVFDFTNLTNPSLNFDIKHSLHNSDYFHVEYSLNGGTTWAQLGGAISPTWYNATNWWRNSYLTPVDAWTNVAQDLCNLSGEPCVKFRVYGRPYYSMPTYTNYHLFAFDNFYVSAGDSDDVEPIEIILSDAGDCAAYSTTETISVLIRNNTCRPIVNLPIDMQLNGGPTISEVVPGPVPRFGTFIYTFTNTLDLSPPGTHNISITTQLATDNVPVNDNLIENRFSSNPINTFPYTENFNADNGGWVSRTTVNHRYFRLDTLPYLNGAQGQGDSWYVETTQSNNGTYIWVESPEFDFSTLTNPRLTMDVKHSLHNSDYFHVEYSLNGGATWTQLGSTEPNWYNAANWWRNSYTAPVDAWTQVQKSLCALAGQSCVKLRVYGRPYYSMPTYSNYHLFAFDNVVIEEGNDLGVITYIDPVPDGCLYTTAQNVTVEVFNFGCNAVTNIPIECDITGILTTTLNGTVPGPIPAGGSVNYTFPTTINMTPLGTYNFNTYTQDPSDVNNTNDSLALSIIVNQITINTFPYFEDFNSGAGNWIATGTAPPLNNGRNFVLGNMTYLNGPQGHGDSWNVETTSSNNGTYIWVESPVFDFTNVTNPKLLMDVKHSLHNSDYFHVEYSINGGTSWTQLGTGTDPYWYNTASWWRNSYTAPVDNWTNFEHTLCNLIGQPCVKFRVYGRPYYSMPTYSNYHLFGFDNFHITDTPLDADVNFVAGCFGSTYQLDVTVVNIDRLCLTSPNITSIDLTYTINGGGPVTQTFTGLNIPFGGSSTVTIPNVTIPNNSSTIMVWGSNPNGVTDQIWENDTAYGYSATWPNCNDHCSNAVDLGLGTTTATQTSNATVDPLEDPNFTACGAITVENTVWYQFTTNSSGDSVTIVFDSQVCAPSQNGIQVSIDSVGTPCDFTTYSNMYCSATNDTAAIQYGPVLLPPNTTYYIAVDGFAGSDCNFDITITGAVNPPLPIELLSFDAQCGKEEGVVELRWMSSTEINNDYYTIERSSDALNFEAVENINGAGNSNNVNSYYFKDEHYSLTGKIYYRLKQTDFNGNYEYFDVKAVDCGKGSNVSIYPNPATGEFIVNTITNSDVTIVMYNSIGQKVLEKVLKAENNLVDEHIAIDELREGIYFVNIKVGEQSEVKKLVIER